MHVLSAKVDLFGHMDVNGTQNLTVEFSEELPSAHDFDEIIVKTDIFRRPLIGFSFTP